MKLLLLSLSLFVFWQAILGGQVLLPAQSLDGHLSNGTICASRVNKDDGELLKTLIE